MQKTPKSPPEGIYILIAVHGKTCWAPVRFSTERPLERDEDGKTWATVQLPAISAPAEGENGVENSDR